MKRKTFETVSEDDSVTKRFFPHTSVKNQSEMLPEICHLVEELKVTAAASGAALPEVVVRVLEGFFTDYEMRFNALQKELGHLRSSILLTERNLAPDKMDPPSYIS